jgi:uncharacterized protein
MILLALVAAAIGAALMLIGIALVDAISFQRRTAAPSSASTAQVLAPFHVDPTWVTSGTPNFRATETVHAPDGSGVTGLWACDGPSTFEWRFGSDETVHLLEGRVEVDYRGRHFTIEPGDTATFHYGTRAVWHVPAHAKKVFVLHQPGRLVRAWRKLRARHDSRG